MPNMQVEAEAAFDKVLLLVKKEKRTCPQYIDALPYRGSGTHKEAHYAE
ncbi:hypothetical protein DFR59_11918 [Falsibacillus pallidus]|uniref:Uncharacterized protein n=1 Tax=Falsibacillus pallidus TaxID=493781 RepID=A0A370G4P4_9BACI|nr:hypothetical protein DFR59_11918 [Falsibacillus pallidus]